MRSGELRLIRQPPVLCGTEALNQGDRQNAEPAIEVRKAELSER